MIRGQAHQEKGHQQDIPRQSADKEHVKRVKIIATHGHDDTADLGEHPRKEHQTAHTEHNGKEHNERFGTLLDQLQEVHRKKDPVELLECRWKKIIVHVKERRDHMETGRHRDKHPEK